MLKAKPKCLQLFVPSVSTQVCQGVSLRTSWTICSGALCKGWVSFFIGCGFLTINIHGRWLGFLILKLHFLRNINSLRNFCSFYHVASMTGGGSSWEHMRWIAEGLLQWQDFQHRSWDKLCPDAVNETGGERQSWPCFQPLRQTRSRRSKAQPCQRSHANSSLQWATSLRWSRCGQQSFLFIYILAGVFFVIL